MRILRLAFGFVNVLEYAHVLILDRYTLPLPGCIVLLGLPSQAFFCWKPSLVLDKSGRGF